MGKKKRRVDARYESPFHPRLALAIAKAAHANASDYRLQAQLLQRHGHAGRAQALAILGHEELGKGLYFALFALGVLGDKPLARQQMFTDHRPKQVMSRTTRLVASGRPDFVDLLSSALPASLPSMTERPSRKQIREFENFLRTLKAGLESQPEKARSFAASIVSTTSVTMKPNLSAPKEDGLYVALDKERRVLEPRGVSHIVATNRIRALRLDLRRCAWIAELRPSYLAVARRLGRVIRGSGSQSLEDGVAGGLAPITA